MTGHLARLGSTLSVALAITTAAVGCGAREEAFDVVDAEVQAQADHAYTIPVGAGLALDAGAPLSILPARLDASVGQTIEIVNDDDRGHLVGPWFVGAGETLRQTFVSPGQFSGECSVHPSGQILVVISP